MSFPEVPEATFCLALFQDEDGRCLLLLLLCCSCAKKTEFAKSLFKNPLELKVGNLQRFPARMGEFKPGTHDTIILDHVRGLDFLVQHQEKLQAKSGVKVEFSCTPGGALVKFTLWCGKSSCKNSRPSKTLSQVLNVF